MRADQLLVERGLAASRSQAVRLISGGLHWSVGSGWRSVAKNGDDLPEEAELRLQDASEARYVSRGGLKLEGALRTTGVSATGKHCLDIGQSTGGFTDCLLQHGAERVVGIDVGHGQLHARIRQDARVVAIEGVNARALDATDLIANNPGGAWVKGTFDAQFRLVVADLSFISLTLVLPAVVPYLAGDGDLLVLVKPQFELQPEHIGKGGIVKDAAFYPQVEQRLRAACAGLQLQVLGWYDSAIDGGDGNREFFLHARRLA